MGKYPDVRIGVIIARNIESNSRSQHVQSMLKESENSVRETFDIESLKDHAVLSRWRSVYERFGSKPRDFRCSIEALIRSVLNGRGVRSINRLVDLYNYISLKHVIPVGGEDLDKAEGDLFLRTAEGSERFTPLGSSSEESPYPGEVIYCDSGGNVLCRRWNWRESEKTKLTEETRNAIIVVEGFDNKVSAALTELEDLVRKNCGADTKSFVLDRDNREIEW